LTYSHSINKLYGVLSYNPGTIFRISGGYYGFFTGKIFPLWRANMKKRVLFMAILGMALALGLIAAGCDLDRDSGGSSGGGGSGGSSCAVDNGCNSGDTYCGKVTCSAGVYNNGKCDC
jgi:uncharacterized membrane protein